MVLTRWLQNFGKNYRYSAIIWITGGEYFLQNYPLSGLYFSKKITSSKKFCWYFWLRFLVSTSEKSLEQKSETGKPFKIKWWNCFGISIMNCWKNKPPIWIFETSNSNLLILTTKAYSLLFFKKYSLVLETLWINIAPNLAVMSNQFFYNLLRFWLLLLHTF